MITGQFALEEHFVQGFEEQMYGGKYFSRIFMFLINGERGCRSELFIRGCFERNGSAQNCSERSCKREAYPYLRGTVPYSTVPKSRVNAAVSMFSSVLMKCALFP